MFRVKIALLSVLLSGLVFVSLGFYSLSVMKTVNIERIDGEILAFGQGHLSAGPPRTYWQNFEQSLKFIYHGKQPDHFIVQIRDPHQEILFQTSNWPPEISVDTFPDFDRTMNAHPPAFNDKDKHRNPPPEAYKACENKNIGSKSRFINPQGTEVQGICEEENGRMVLRKTFPRSIEYQNDNNQPRQELRQFQTKSDPAVKPLPQMKKSSFATVDTKSGEWRTGIMGTERITMIVGMNLSRVHEDINSYRNYFLATVPLVLIFLAGGGWLISQRALKPVALIADTAEKISHKALNQRIPLIHADKEFSRLVQVINEMLDRLEMSFKQALRFSADAAHELQTPLTILQGELDNAVQHAEIGSDEQQRYNSLLEEVQMLKMIVQKLLVLARADAGKLALKLEPTDMSALVESSAEDAGVIAPHLQIEKEIIPGITVKADAELLAQAIRNLMSNAVKYNLDRGFIRFELLVREQKAIFTISNTGATIPESDRQKIFDRFYRVDKSRSKTTSGTGLGLSLAREIVIAHHGDLILNMNTGNIVSFTMSLPKLS